MTRAELALGDVPRTSPREDGTREDAWSRFQQRSLDLCAALHALDGEGCSGHAH